jgi:small-conductance mechanosensitive channel
MTRVTEFRTDACRAYAAHRERVSTSPARLTRPLLAAVIGIGGAAVVSNALGYSFGAVLAITAVVTVAGAMVAHRSVSSIFAGLLLLLARPYAPGERVRLYSPRHARTIDAEIVRVGLANTTLCTGTGLLLVPNARLLRGVPQQPGADVSG